MGAQRERGGQRRIARGAAEYFMVMDVPHGVLVCGVFGGKAGVLKRAGGCSVPLLASSPSVEKTQGGGVPVAF